MTDESVEALIGKRFIARSDVKAIQNQDGTYVPDRSKLTMGDLRAHVSGQKTLGHYLLRQDDICKFFCFDIDLDKEGVMQNDDGELVPINPREEWVNPDSPWREDLTIELRCMADGLAGRIHRVLGGMPTAIAYSGGKGMHVYGFTGPDNAADVRKAAHLVLENQIGATFEKFRGDNFWKKVNIQAARPSNVTIEVFPKQDSLEGKDLGNLMRLPLGVNRKTGQKYFFTDPNTPLNQLVPADALEVLKNGVVWR